MNSTLVREWLFPLHERIRGRPTLKVLSELRSTETYDPEQLQDLQWRKLKQLLNYAASQTEYYRALFASLGAHPRDVKTPADFARLPLLTKETIRVRHADLISGEFRRGRGLVRNATSGSTGEPLVFFTTLRREAALNAAKLRGRAWWGLQMGDREIDFWGPGRSWGAKDRILELRDRLLNIRDISAFHLNENALERALALLRRWKPKFLYVYPSAFFRFTLFLQERGVNAAEFAPEVIICSAENLYETQRALFRQFYGARVVNEYGSHDAGLIAFECPAERLHLTQEQVYLEVVAESADAAAGKFVVTDLENLGQPFIRYQIGDYGELSTEKCPCGRGLAVLRRILGRATEMLRATSGDLVPGFALTRTFRDIAGVREFQVVQERLNLLRIRIVKNDLYTGDSQAAIQRSLRRYLGEEMQFSFEFPLALERRSSGKCSWFISSLPNEGQKAA
ncbi:MAG: phenylacetate--CoA ligase family protein [Candidatus Binatia bacterium]